MILFTPESLYYMVIANAAFEQNAHRLCVLNKFLAVEALELKLVWYEEILDIFRFCMNMWQSKDSVT